MSRPQAGFPSPDKPVPRTYLNRSPARLATVAVHATSTAITAITFRNFIILILSCLIHRGIGPSPKGPVFR
ncbi:hypothetical protein THTE_2649 [Thermogutta terrifontis]|uniref:Uncharacterized protein n=1 Tax=Thermogutta terrifontis TaxID=1331910 RepID=A0A286RH13_9BACT|nr:hypothetical protein THTE_2649 [Thermogutta terrifontis]